MTTITVIDEPEDPAERALLVEGQHDFASVTAAIARVSEQKIPRGWYLLLGISVAMLLNLGACLAYVVWTGIGV